MKRPLVIGECPGSKGQPEGWVALDPRSATGKRLISLSGIQPPEGFHQLFEVVNLLPTDWDTELSRVTVARWWEEGWLADRRVVLLGSRVRDAYAAGLGLRMRPVPPWFDWRPHGTAGMVAVSPHPSGLNRTWNDEDVVRRARKFWGELADETRLKDKAGLIS